MDKIEKLTYLADRLYQAERAMVAQLAEVFPKRQQVLVKLNCRQTNLTLATVVDHERSGHVRVSLENAKPWSKRPCRSVYFTEVEAL